MKLLLSAFLFSVTVSSADIFRDAIFYDTASINRFISGGFDILTKDKTGRNIFYYLCRGGQDIDYDTAIANLFLSKGFKIDSRDLFGNTPLFYSVRFGNLGMTDFLLKRKNYDQCLSALNVVEMLYDVPFDDDDYIRNKVRYKMNVVPRSCDYKIPDYALFLYMRSWSAEASGESQSNILRIICSHLSPKRFSEKTLKYIPAFFKHREMGELPYIPYINNLDERSIDALIKKGLSPVTFEVRMMEFLDKKDAIQYLSKKGLLPKNSTDQQSDEENDSGINDVDADDK